MADDKNQSLRDAALAASQDPNNPYLNPTANPFDLRATPATNSFEDLQNPYYNPNAAQDQQKAVDALKSPEPPPMDSSKDVKGAEPFVKTGGATVKIGSNAAPASTGVPGVSPYTKYANEFEQASQPAEQAAAASAQQLQEQNKAQFGWDEKVASGQYGVPDQVIHHPGLVDLEAEKRKQDAIDQAIFTTDLQRMQTDSKVDDDRRDAKLAADRAEAANMKVDPKKFYKNAGTLGTIVAAIAQGAGAFGAAITHTPNFAAEIINKAVDRDVDAQEKDIQNKWKNVELEGDDNKQKYIREQGARKDMIELRMMQHQGALDEINNMSAQINDATAKTQLSQLATQQQQQILSLKDQRMKIRLEARLQDYKAAQAAATQDPYSNVNMRNKYAEYARKREDVGGEVKSYEEWSKDVQGGGGRSVVGQAKAGGNLPATTAAKIASGNTVADGLAKMQTLLKGPLNADMVGQYETLHALLTAEVSKNATGRYSPAETEAIKEALPPPTAISASIRNMVPVLGEKDLAALKAIEDQVRAENSALSKNPGTEVAAPQETEQGQ